MLVMGGSQGASGINDLVIRSLDYLKAEGKASGAHGVTRPTSALQFFHLAGPADAEKVRQAYAQRNIPAVVHSFFGEMELALGAATVTVSRSGASSLAELAAMRVPSVLIPFPAATDNHQFFNAKAFEETGAARLLEQKMATPESVAQLILELVEQSAAREQMQAALARWHAPQAAQQIAETMLQVIAQETGHSRAKSRDAQRDCGCGGEHRTELRAKTAA
jgi:UDP-N-acetylglucosamine--N-acetylmuramyl-(pentapeptide) pyrophosphoryl-undecaprenol N-acetylglucosamine transferase